LRVTLPFAAGLSTAATVIVIGFVVIPTSASVTGVDPVTVTEVPPFTVTVVGSGDVQVTILVALTSVPNWSVTVATAVVDAVPERVELP
jgi:hypothetical protein